MYKIKIMNEFMHGAIWVCDEEGISINYELIDNDIELQELNKKTEELFDSYYEFDSHEQPVWFNEELEKKTSREMLDLIIKIKNRLSEIDDGSFIIEDTESERLIKLTKWLNRDNNI